MDRIDVVALPAYTVIVPARAHPIAEHDESLIGILEPPNLLVEELVALLRTINHERADPSAVFTHPHVNDLDQLRVGAPVGVIEIVIADASPDLFPVVIIASASEAVAHRRDDQLADRLHIVAQHTRDSLVADHAIHLGRGVVAQARRQLDVLLPDTRLPRDLEIAQVGGGKSPVELVIGQRHRHAMLDEVKTETEIGREEITPATNAFAHLLANDILQLAALGRVSVGCRALEQGLHRIDDVHIPGQRRVEDLLGEAPAHVHPEILPVGLEERVGKRLVIVVGRIDPCAIVDARRSASFRLPQIS